MRRATIGGILFRSAAVIAIAAAAALANGHAFAAPQAVGASANDRAEPSARLSSFHSEAELQRWLKRRTETARRNAPPPPPAPPPPSSMVAGAVADSAAPAPAAEARAAAQQPGITNNQEANVDEGDIVKMHGNDLVVLRRGRLFTVSLAGGQMRAVDSINAYPPHVNASADWYDEMLVSGDRVIVIGYSYGRGGTEINRFHIDDHGRLRWEDAYHLRSNDYYSSRNYASRLVGHNLILYSPLYMSPWGDDPMVSFPAMRKWTGDSNGEFRRIVSASQVYFSPRLDQRQVQAVHTVTKCDLTAPVLNCTAESVLGPAGRTFYVSSHAVYVWTTAYWWGGGNDGATPSILFRLPLDGSAPSAVGVSGSPVDQFSFREDYEDGFTNILVRAEGAGDAMWAPEHSSGAIALLRLPIRAFGDGTRDVAVNRYRALPHPEGTSYDFHNRFVGDYVLYGNGNGWGRPRNGENTLVVAPVKGGEPTELDMPHGVDRIEVMGRDAVVVGSDRSNVYFAAVELTRRAPKIGDTYTMEGAAQAETRSHGFFFKMEGADSSGVIGLPVARPARAAYRQLFEASAAMVFLRRGHDGNFSPLGTLDSHPEDARNDNCVASCVDWYGNARPIFLGDRTFALMGYELVEGDLGRRNVREIGRLNFAPDAHIRQRPDATQ